MATFTHYLEIEVSVEYEHTPAERGKRDRGLQMEPDWPECATVTSVKIRHPIPGTNPRVTRVPINTDTEIIDMLPQSEIEYLEEEALADASADAEMYRDQQAEHRRDIQRETAMEMFDGVLDSIKNLGIRK